MNAVRAAFRKVFPPPRRAVTWKSTLPLIAFAAVFLPLLIGLWMAERADFARPWAFCLLIVTPWIWWMSAAGHAGLPAVRGGVAAFLRLLICGLLICVLAEPRSVRVSDVLSVVFAVDVSDSVNEARNSALQFVADSTSQKPGDDEAGLIVFGRNAAVELPPDASFPFERYLTTRVGQDATNLEQSLALSSAMLPEDNPGRVVLVSDGTETVGRLNDVVDDLQARGVPVFVVPIDYDYEAEVLLERLDLPRFVRLNETYEASVVVTSLKEGSGTLVLSQDGNELQSLPVEFPAGKSRIAVPIRVESPGYYEYSARLEVAADLDSRIENNEVRNYIFIEGPGRILLVTDPLGDKSEWTPLMQALSQDQRRLDQMTALEFPLDPLALMPYDAVVFADVAADSLTGAQMQALHDGIRNLGIGFLMVGGPNSFGPGGYQGSAIADALPLSLEISNRKILPKGALAIILHTCEFPQGNSWAKRITRQAIKVLNSQDEVGVLGYGSGGTYWIVEMSPAAEYDAMVPKINGAQIGDMPDFASSMQLGLKGLLETDAASRHMIIISDGDPSLPAPQLMQQFKDNSVSVSTVAVFPHNGDTTAMEMIAGQTGGRFYYPSDPATLPSIFVKEAKTLRRNQVQTRTFVPELESIDPMIKEIGVPPELHGYVLTTPRDDPRAQVILSAPPATDDPAAEGERDPILAVWRYGLGVSAAFTSDLTSRWGKDWLKWGQFRQLVSQMLTRIARARREQFLRVYTYTNGNEGVVVVEDFHPEESLLDLTATISGPNQFERTIPVRQIAPRRYQASVSLQGQGRYQVQIGAVGADRKETAYGGFIVSYSPEYLRFRSNPIALRDLADKTGGDELDPGESPEVLSEQVFGDRVPRRSTQPVFDWLLVMLACAIPLDVAVRRVQLDPTPLLQLFRRNAPRESTATMGALLQRTDQVRGSLRNDQSAAEPPQESWRDTVPRPDSTSTASRSRSGAASGSRSTPAASPGKKTPASGTNADDGSTTSRLLAMKRKREQDGDS